MTVGQPETEGKTILLKIVHVYGIMMLAAFGQTLLLALLSLIVACLLGLLFGLLGTVQNRVCNALSILYVNAIRGWPLIVLAFFIYFTVPQFLRDVGFDHARLSALNAGILALSLNCGAYMAEIMRAGIQSVPTGQMEAARSLGMSYSHAMYKVVLPQAIRTMIPSIINQFIITLKDTSILSVIGFPELTNTTKTVVANTMNTQGWAIAGVMYMVVILLLSYLSHRVERRLSNGR